MRWSLSRVFVFAARCRCRDYGHTTDEDMYKGVMRAVAAGGEWDRALDLDNGDWYRQHRHQTQPWFS
jgi:hypothetical protein